jgi:serine/threonine protein kinase
MDALRIGGRFRNYLLEELVGQGGFGQVFRGVHELTGREAAIKVIRAGGQRDPAVARERARREAVALMRMRHPNVPDIYDMELVDGTTTVILMEYLRGRDLAAILSEKPTLGVGTALWICTETCKPLIVLHGAGAVHRDIKPGNIFICDEVVDEKSRVRLLDFGAALASSTLTGLRGSGPHGARAPKRLTARYTLIGTFLYMAPEIAEDRRRDIDGRADQYALGCVLWEMLAGSPLFMPDPDELVEPAQYLEWHRSRVIPDLRPIRPDVPERVCKMLERMLAKKHSERYPSTEVLYQAFHTALEEMRSQMSVEHAAFPPSPAEEREAAAMEVANEASTREETPRARALAVTSPAAPAPPLAVTREDRPRRGASPEAPAEEPDALDASVERDLVPDVEKPPSFVAERQFGWSLPDDVRDFTALRSWLERPDNVAKQAEAYGHPDVIRVVDENVACNPEVPPIVAIEAIQRLWSRGDARSTDALVKARGSATHPDVRELLEAALAALGAPVHREVPLPAPERSTIDDAKPPIISAPDVTLREGSVAPSELHDEPIPARQEALALELGPSGPLVELDVDTGDICYLSVRSRRGRVDLARLTRVGDAFVVMDRYAAATTVWRGDACTKRAEDMSATLEIGMVLRLRGERVPFYALELVALGARAPAERVRGGEALLVDEALEGLGLRERGARGRQLRVAYAVFLAFVLIAALGLAWVARQRGWGGVGAPGKKLEQPAAFGGMNHREAGKPLEAT